MVYNDIRPAVFLDRPNRFIASADVGGRSELCHVKNTGRCRELFLPGAEIYVRELPHSARKTRFDLIAVRKGDRLVNVDSGAPNRLFREWVESGAGLPGARIVRAEQTYGRSRFDFLLTRGDVPLYAEVKGVTLEEDGVARFPDAPTERGVRHLRELADAKAAGFGACAVFVIQMQGVRRFEPNARTHPEFARALREAARAGVEIYAFDCVVTPGSVTPGSPVPVRL